MPLWPLVALFFLKLSLAQSYVSSTIKWQPYHPKYLSADAAKFYTYRSDAIVSAPLSHLPWHRQQLQTRGKSIKLYIRKFSRTPFPQKHIWFITGGPGCSTDGVERALSVKLPDAAIYLMDNRGLEQSEAICTYSQSKYCVRNVKGCFENYPHPSYTISLHETAQDYNYVSQLILRAHGGEVFLYGSSYGSILAYRAFKFNPKLYSGLLLEAFMPDFALNAQVDIRQHVADTCMKSELCRARIPSTLDKEGIANLMARILESSTNNPCKLLFSFLSGLHRPNLHATISAAVRFLVHRHPKSRGVVLPMLYSLAYCPSIDDFVKFATHYTELTKRYTDDVPAATVTPTMHASLYPQTNRFVGPHIRLSEYFGNTPELARYCVQMGSLNESNWADGCGMLSDYSPDFEPFLYEPEPARPKWEDLVNSATRIVIFTGKWDTQTPHDFAQREFDSLPVANKFIFTADHAGHGIIDTADCPGLSLNLALNFLMTGNPAAQAQITDILSRHNADADSVWRALQKEDSSFKHLWSFQEKAKKYSWMSFLVTLFGCCAPPLLTFIIFRNIRIK